MRHCVLRLNCTLCQHLLLCYNCSNRSHASRSRNKSPVDPVDGSGDATSKSRYYDERYRERERESGRRESDRDRERDRRTDRGEDGHRSRH